MKRIRLTLIEGLILLVIAVLGLFIGAMITHDAWEKLSCKNGSEVPDGDGSLDCWGSEAYKHCKPATHFVCHDE